MAYAHFAYGDKNLPPGPTLSPMVQALRTIGQPYEFLRECAEAFGDVFTLDMGLDGEYGGKYVVLSHPEAIRQVVTAEVGALRVCNTVFSPLFGPGSMLLRDGEDHLRQRRRVMPAFQHRAIAGYGEVIRDVVSSATAHWDAGHQFVAQEFFQQISLDIIFRIVFGCQPTMHFEKLKRSFIVLVNDRRLGLGFMARQNESGTLPALGDFWAQFESVRELALELVARGRREASDNTILSMLSAAVDEDGASYSDDELRDEILTLLATGHETTATALSWGFYWISRLESVRRRLRAELTARGDASDWMDLRYLDATCKEILRIYPIVPSLFRQVRAKPFKVSDLVFQPGTFLSPSIYLAHHRQEAYVDPDRFDPERFLNRTFSQYEYLPFGAGARRCVGMHLAMYQMKALLATLLQDFEFEAMISAHVAPVRRYVTVVPGEPLRMGIAKRVR